jgi:hypothetical protein
VCGRRLSVQVSKAAYTYFFCLGQKNDPAGTCREPYVPAEKLETEITALYQRVELPETWLHRLEAEMAAEALDRQRRDAGQRDFHTRRLTKAEAQRRKLLDAYYNGAIDVATLKTEQDRIGRDIAAAKDTLADLDADLTEWQEILSLAGRFATRCADAYRKADDPTRKLFNSAVFDRVEVKDGCIATVSYQPPFDDLFKGEQFEYETLVEVAGIEPASFGTKAGLLRAQPACRFLSPTGPAGEPVTGSAAVRCSGGPRSRAHR